MKKFILSLIIAILGISVLITTPVVADECVKTAILGGGEVCDKGGGDSVIRIVELVIDILSIGIGIIGVIAITIVGIQYLTAGGNEEKTRKAKRRLFEIIIGIAAFAIMYATLSFILPGFRAGGGSSESNTTVPKPNSQQNNGQQNIPK